MNSRTSPFLCVARACRKHRNSFGIFSECVKGGLDCCLNSDPFASRLFSSCRRLPSRPVPIVFLAGEGLNGRIWSESVRFFSERGYESFSLEFDQYSSGSSLSEQLSLLSADLRSLRSLPPVLVAHSAATYLAQKFLESEALSALVLVNPISIDPAQTSIKLFDRWIACFAECEASGLRGTSFTNINDAKAVDATFLRAVLWNYYFGGDDFQHQLHSQDSSYVSTIHADILQKLSIRTPFPSDFFYRRICELNDTTNTGLDAGIRDRRLTFPIPLAAFRAMHLGEQDVRINLEPGSVPTMLAFSDGDNAVITAEDMEELRLLHRVPSDYQVRFRTAELSLLERRWPHVQTGGTNLDINSITSTGDSTNTITTSSRVNNDTEFNERGSRLPMITHQQQFNNAIFQWLETTL